MFKDILKYICIYVSTVIILFSALVLTTKIPKEVIIENLKESAEFYKEKNGIQRKNSSREYEGLHYHADSILLNIMYFCNSSDAVKSVMEAKYYHQERFYDSNSDFIDAIENDKKANEQYLRYWHGSLSILRPMMTIFNIEQIYIITNIMFWILYIVLIIILLKKYKTLAIVFIISSTMCTLQITPYCIEYIWTVLIMFIVAIVSLLIEQRGNKILYRMYFVTGIVTCYFDFLSTETLTILIPLLLVTLIRYKENRVEKWIDIFKFLFVSGMLWFMGYSLMWITKWAMASIILDINAIEYVKKEALNRINWNSRKALKYGTYLETLRKNIIKIYPIDKLLNNKKILTSFVCIIGGIIVSIVILNNKIEKKQNKKHIKWILLLIAIIPYLRYIVLVNHSYCHSFFTFRAQLPSLISIMFIVIYSIDKNILKKEIKIKWRKNGTNNINP